MSPPKEAEAQSCDWSKNEVVRELGSESGAGGDFASERAPVSPLHLSSIRSCLISTNAVPGDGGEVTHKVRLALLRHQPVDGGRGEGLGVG